MELGTRVVWCKLKGARGGSEGSSGFGILTDYGVGKVLLISGDYGVVTTEIKETHERAGELVVVTQNSVYELKEHK